MLSLNKNIETNLLASIKNDEHFNKLTRNPKQLKFDATICLPNHFLKQSLLTIINIENLHPRMKTCS